MTIGQIIKQVEVSKVTITGGEPLCQKDELIELINSLCFAGIKVTIETNGSLKIPYNYIAHSDLVGWVIDYKFEYADQMIFSNFYNAGLWIGIADKEWYIRSDALDKIIYTQDDGDLDEFVSQVIRFEYDSVKEQIMAISEKLSEK